MAVGFPPSPNIGDTFLDWTFRGNRWEVTGGDGGAPSVHVAPNPPASPQQGALWWRTTNGQLYVRYVENGNASWVVANSGGGAGNIGVTDGSPAGPGQIGEYITGNLSAASISTTTGHIPFTFPIPAGDWDVKVIYRLVYQTGTLQTSSAAVQIPGVGDICPAAVSGAAMSAGALTMPSFGRVNTPSAITASVNIAVALASGLITLQFSYFLMRVR